MAGCYILGGKIINILVSGNASRFDALDGATSIKGKKVVAGTAGRNPWDENRKAKSITRLYFLFFYFMLHDMKGLFTMIKTDSKLINACKQADKQATKTGKRFYVTADYKVNEYKVACFGIVVYVTSRSINNTSKQDNEEF